MLTLLLLIIFGVVVWAVSASGDKKNTPGAVPTLQQPTVDLRQHNQGWTDFIAGYSAVAKTKAEKALLARMLKDIETQRGIKPHTSVSGQMGTPQAKVGVLQQGDGPSTIFGGPANADDAWNRFETTTTALPLSTVPASALEKKPEAVQLDNASLLLYFGAFLFVASAGLFVAFAQTPGILKLLTVLAVTFVMYETGVWLYQHKAKLRQAGQAFAGIGIVMAPLVGAALYAFVLNKSYGAVVWLITSLFCVGLYEHALRVFRNTLMAYILIFTFVSLFESGVGVLGVPVYFYGWGLAIAGIIVRLLSKRYGWTPELQEASNKSVQLFVPVAVFVAMLMLSSFGAIQFGVSLLLAAIYYGLEALDSQGNEQELYAAVTQAAAAAGIGTVVHGILHDINFTAITVLSVNLLQLLMLCRGRHTTNEVRRKLWHNFASVLLLLSVAGVLVSISYAPLLLAALLAIVVNGATIWHLQKRPEAYGMAAVAFLAAPYIFCQVVVREVPVEVQAFLALAALAMALVVYLGQLPGGRDYKGWDDVAIGSYALGVVALLVTGVFAGPLFCLGIALVLAVLTSVAISYGRRLDLAELLCVVLAVPLLRSWDDPKNLLVAIVVVLAALILLSLRYRRESLRWASTLVWLLLPFGLGHSGYGFLGGLWPAEAYAWGYVVVMAGLMFSRAVASGRLFLSNNVPVVSMMRSASVSYVAGYASAGLLAVGISLASAHSQLHTSLILAVLIGATVYAGLRVERQDDVLALVPVMLQALALSVIRPPASGPILSGFLLVSIGLAAAMYLLGYGLQRTRPTLKALTESALIAAFIAPGSILLAQDSWLMSLGLLVAGILLSHYLYRSTQATQASSELAGGIIVVAVGWFLWWAGIRELQAYTHILAALLAVYALWRTQRGEKDQASDYIWSTLAVTTVPLALEALSASGAKGGLYGWWLLLEQIAIMLLGMAIKRRFVTMWGLYVAVGAVLYQLRGLGYAALAVLALFLIGLAVYQLQKSGSFKSDGK